MNVHLFGISQHEIMVLIGLDPARGDDAVDGGIACHIIPTNTQKLHEILDLILSSTLWQDVTAQFTNSYRTA